MSLIELLWSDSCKKITHVVELERSNCERIGHQLIARTKRFHLGCCLRDKSPFIVQISLHMYMDDL